MRLDALLQMPIDWLPLADAAIKATLLLGAAALTARALRHSSAAARHLVWTSALIATLVLPLASLAVPEWRVPLVTLSQSTSVGSARTGSGAAETAASAAMRARLGRSAEASPQTPVLENGSVPSLAGLSWSAVLFATWLAGAMVILVRLGVGMIAVQLMSRKTVAADDAVWLPLAHALATDLGVSRVTFRRSTHPSMLMPIAWGIARPVVVMPADADGWSDDRLRIVLLHELAHVKRADCLTHMLAQVACALHWMNPLAWIATRRARAERERACDDLVLACGTPGADYADQLLQIARDMRPGRFSSTLATASLAMAHPSQLEGRLMAILDPSVPRAGLSRVRTLIGSAIALMTLVPLASVQPFTYAQAPAMDALTPASPAQSSAGSVPPQINVSRRVAHAVEQQVTQDTIQGVTQAMTQGVTQGTLEGVTQGVLQGVLQGIPDAVAGAIGGVFQGRPNPNPNPMPKLDRRGREDAEIDREARPKADPKLVAALTEALKDTDKEVREMAMHALVQMRAPNVYEPLVQALRDSSADVRESAVFGLGQLQDRRAVAPLATALKDSAPGVREQAAFALGQIGDESAIDALVPGLKDEHANVREQVAFALGQLGAKGAVDPLIGALKDSDPQVREQAAFALGQIGDARAIDGLMGALKDSNSQVRQQAAFALGQLAR